MTIAKHAVMGGEVNLYKRGRSKYWQCSTFLNGHNWRKSTKETDIRKAKDVAEGWYLELRDKSRHGVLRAEKTFADAAKQFEREYVVITQGNRNAEYVDTMMRRLRNYLIPFLALKAYPKSPPALFKNIASGGKAIPSRATIKRANINISHPPEAPCTKKWLRFGRC